MSQASRQACIGKAYREIAELEQKIGALESRRAQARTRLVKLQRQLETARGSQ